ncbi:MAG: thioredoxin family protein [Draconibacterium sp.]
MKKYWPLLLIVLLLILLIFGFLSRSTLLNNYISEKMKNQTTMLDSISVARTIESKFNYTNNKLNFDFTLIEFGSTGCTVCKQMEPVLDEVRKLENPKVNVVFLNIMHPENLPQMKFFGVSAVPLQILLDKNGKEFFRHYGFISAADLVAETLNQSKN